MTDPLKDWLELRAGGHGHDPEVYHQYGDALAERLKVVEGGIEGHGEPCYYCDEPCDSYAGNPGKWPVALTHEDEPGKVEWHHAACVSERLRELVAVEDSFIASDDVMKQPGMRQSEVVAGVVKERDALAERLETAERMVHELQKDNTRLVEERRAAERRLRLDDPKLVAALKNVGVDAACGACMAQFLTGTAPYEHTCEGNKPVGSITDLGPIPGADAAIERVFDTWLTPEQREETKKLKRSVGYAPIREQVLEFHRAMGVPVLDRPTVPADERVRLRLKLVMEEAFELCEACLPRGDERSRFVELAKANLQATIECSKLDVDLPEVADALADIDYVIEGARLEFGIDGAPVAAGVHAANMRKLDGPVREDGKKMKPEGWQPFDVAAELKRQGWEPVTEEAK